MNTTAETQPQTADEVIRAELQEDETLLWSGKPNRNAYARSNPIRAIFGRVLLIIGIVMLYFAHEAVAANPRSPGMFVMMFGTIFAIFGLGLAVKPFWHWYTAPATYYGVTDRRAMIIRTRPLIKREFFSPLHMIEIATENYGTKLGNIIFATEPFGRIRGLRAAVGFWGVENMDVAAAELRKMWTASRA